MTVQITSRLAYENYAIPHLGERQREVFDALTRPMTNSEIAEKLGVPINTITPRIFEMRHMKIPLVREFCKRKCRVTGRLAIAWMKNNGQLF